MANSTTTLISIMIIFFFIILGSIIPFLDSSKERIKSHHTENTLFEPFVRKYTGSFKVCSNYINTHRSLCIKKNVTSAIFLDSFRQDVTIEWTAKNPQIKEEDYDWWMTIQNRKKLDMVGLINRLHKAGFPVEDYVVKSEGSCRKCAVVGSSSNLRENCYGELIDDHDVVIRFNTAPVKGYETYVGSKTTHRIAYPESIPKYVANDTNFILMPFKPEDVEWLLSAVTDHSVHLSSYFDVPDVLNINVSRGYVINPNFFRYVHNSWNKGNGRYPSTGMIGTIYALHKCDHISIFGFGADSNGEWQHYYETFRRGVISDKSDTTQHSISGEHLLLKTMEESGIVHKIYV